MYRRTDFHMDVALFTLLGRKVFVPFMALVVYCLHMKSKISTDFIRASWCYTCEKVASINWHVFRRRSTTQIFRTVRYVVLKSLSSQIFARPPCSYNL
jgi:hypothetical protein